MDETQDQLNSGVPDWVQRLVGRALDDVRVHDSTQAGDLAARLGARAFAAGRHVYIRPELLHPRTPHAAALLAHELTHAAEQIGAPRLPPGQGRNAGPAPGPHLAPRSGPPAVQRATSSTGAGGEAQARAVEAAALQAQQSQQKPAQAAPDPEALADLVYRKMAVDLRVDRERLADQW